METGKNFNKFNKEIGSNNKFKKNKLTLKFIIMFV